MPVRKPRTGLKNRKITPDILRAKKAALEKLPMHNTRQLKKSILCLRNLHVRTMQNTGLRQLSCHAANKTFLNQAMNNKRLEFALVH